MTILINKGWIQARKGLKQEDPLSPLLFALVADVLNRLLNLTASNSMIRGIGPLNTTGSIFLLQYINDTIMLKKFMCKILNLFCTPWNYSPALRLTITRAFCLALVFQNLPVDHSQSSWNVLGKLSHQLFRLSIILLKTRTPALELHY